MIREYRTISDLSGLFFTATNIKGVTPNELGEVLLPDGEVCPCQVIEIAGDKVCAALLASPRGIGVADCKVRFFGYGLELPLSEDLLGRVWNSLGEPIDGGSAILPEKYAKVNSQPVNPLARASTEKTLQVDGEPPLRLGEERTVLSNLRASIAATVTGIAHQAKIDGDEAALTIVISATGLPFEERGHLIDELRHAGLTARTALFASEPTDPPILRLATAYTAMTAAEYFAFDKERHVLFIEADMSACIDAFTEAMQSVSAANWEAPGVGAYPPSHPYADLAVLRERIGLRQGRGGSITLLSVLTEE